MLESGSDKLSKWSICDGVVCIKSSTEVIVHVSAREIAGAEFKNRFEIRKNTVGEKPSSAFPHLNFNRFPLELQLLVSLPDRENALPPYCWLQFNDGGTKSIFAVSVPSVDQFIFENEWYPLNLPSLGEVEAVLKKAKVDNLGCLSLRQYVDLVLAGESYRTIVPCSEIPDAILKIMSVERTPKTLCTGFQGDLYDYQATGVNWILQVCDEDLGCILGDEMGLGKTVQVIAVIAQEADAGRVPTLIIAPATLLENWKRELARFAPSLTTRVHQGPSRTGFPSELKKCEVIITSYDTAIRDFALLTMIKWNLVVLDEAQAIKNPETLRALTVAQIPKRIGIAMSGTPVENRLRDIWSIMEFTCNGMLGDLRTFERRFEDTMECAQELEVIITPLMLRRTVSEVATDLPERIDIPQAIELSPNGALAYEVLRKDILDEYGANGTLVSLTRLRMFCTHPFLVEGASGDPALVSNKYRRLVDILREIVVSGRKCLVFTSFAGMADILKDDLSRRFGVYVRVVDGRVPVEHRQPLIDEFQEQNGAAILVLNPRAAGTGLNITAANHVIHYNLEWNPAIEDQASARAYRRGQERPVTIHRLLYASTVEEVIDERVQRKRQLALAAVIGTDGTDEDLDDIVRALEASPVHFSEDTQ